jgi:hypothetical protein
VAVAAVAVMSVVRRVVPGVVLMVMRRRRVAVSRRVMPRVVLVMRRRRVPVPWRVMPRVVPVMRRLPVSRGMVPRVMVVSVPVVIVMTARGRVRSDAAVVEVQGVRLADAVSRLRLLHGWDAARAAAGTAAPRVP